MCLEQVSNVFQNVVHASSLSSLICFFTCTFNYCIFTGVRTATSIKCGASNNINSHSFCKRQFTILNGQCDRSVMTNNSMAKLDTCHCLSSTRTPYNILSHQNPEKVPLFSQPSMSHLYAYVSLNLFDMGTESPRNSYFFQMKSQSVRFDKLWCYATVGPRRRENGFENVSSRPD